MAETKSKGFITQAGYYFVYLLFRMVEGLLHLVPLPACAMLGRCIGWIVFVFFANYRNLALENLRIAFGREKDEAWLRQTAKEHFMSLASNFFCGLKLPLMTEEDIAKRVTVEGIEHVKAVVDSKRPILYAICHMSCWELLTQIPTLFTFGLEPSSIYQPLANPYLDAHVRRRREKRGYRLFDRTEGFSGPIKHLRAQQGAVGVLVDQHAGDKGVWSPFFDRLASTTSLPALMSIRCSTPLLPLAVYDNGLARWRLVCYPPVDSGEAKPTAEGITAMTNVAVEQMIRHAPHNWFWVHNRWKTPKPEFLLSQYRRGVVYPKGYDLKRLQTFNLIVRSPNWLGDACMAFPAVRALKKGRPDLKLTVFCPAKLAELWKSLPEVDDLVLKENKEGLRSVARRIKAKGPFDAGILFTNSTRSTLEFWLAGIPRLVGYQGSLRSKLLDQVVSEPKRTGPPAHHALRYLRIAGNCGAKVDDATLMAPPQPEASRTSARLGICAGAEYGQAKRWPMDRFADVANRLSTRWPEIEWQLFGAPGEKALGEKLSGMMPATRHRNLVGNTNLTELIAHLKTCRLLVTNDTGTMHLAAALGVPTVSIFGSTEPVLTGPLGDRNAIVRHHVACSPCFKRECPFGHYECMTGVTAERVEVEVMNSLQAK